MINETYIIEAKAALEKELSLHLRAEEDWMKVLALQINELVQNDFMKFIGILYRLDVDESKVRKVLKDQRGEDAGDIIAKLIFERLLQKVKSRQEFSGKNTDINEDEKW